ncbi:MAG: hypothetical protein AAF587_17080 [Bacteroidota bacterium]
MTKHTPLFPLLIGMFLLWIPNQLAAQLTCDEASKAKRLVFEPADPTINKDVKWKKETSGADSNYTTSLDLMSPTGGTFTVEAGSLVDEQNNSRISSTKITLSSSTLILEKGKLQELVVTIPAAPKPGKYEGKLRIYHQYIVAPKETAVSQGTETSDASSTDSAAQSSPPPPPAKPDTFLCSWLIDVNLNVFEEGGIVMTTGEEAFSVNTVPSNWFNFILPTDSKSEAFNLNVQNTGVTPINVKDFSIRLRGKKSTQFLEKNSLILVDSNKVIPPGGESDVTFAINDDQDIEEDEYSGQIFLTFPERGNEKISAQMTLNRKMGVLGAIFTLLLGVLVGRMMKDVEKPESQEQIKLLDQLVPLRAQVADLEDKVSKKDLLSDLKKIEKNINKIKDPEIKKQVNLQLPELTGKVQQIVKIESLVNRVKEKVDNSGIGKEDPIVGALYDQVNEVRDLVLRGEKEPKVIESSLGKVKFLMKQLNQGTMSSRSALGEAGETGTGTDTGVGTDTQPISGPKQDGAISQNIDDLIENTGKTIGVDADDDPVELTFWTKVEDVIFKIMGFLTGFQANARVRYAVFRPIAMLVAFTVIILLGFQEIYVKGNNPTFGSEGIYDYLKLFLWGLVSDVFSRSVFNTQAKTFTPQAFKQEG